MRMTMDGMLFHRGGRKQTELQMFGFLLTCGEKQDLLDEWLDKLSEDHFSVPQLAECYRLMREMREDGWKVDASSFFPRMMAGGGGGESRYGDLSWLLRADEVACTPAMLPSAFRFVDEEAQRVRARSVLEAGATELDSESPGAVISGLSDRLEGALGATLWTRWEGGAEEAHRELAEVDEESGITTGIEGLDRMLKDWRPGAVYVLVAHTGHGKTMFACHMAWRAILCTDRRTLFFSAEMGKGDLHSRLLATASGVPIDSVVDHVRGHETRMHYGTKVDAAGADLDGRVVYAYRPGMTCADVVSRAIVQHRESPLGLVVVDYLQRLEPTDEDRKAPRHVAVGGMSSALKNLAMRLQVPLLLLAQPARRWMDDGERLYPGEHHLGESARVGHDADAVISMGYPSRLEHLKDDGEYRDRCVLAVVKSRRGATGATWARYYPDRVGFEGLSESQYPHGRTS